MITVKIKDLDNLISGGLSEFQIELDTQNSQVLVFYRDKLLGPLLAVYGISDEEFIAKVSRRS